MIAKLIAVLVLAQLLGACAPEAHHRVRTPPLVTADPQLERLRGQAIADALSQRILSDERDHASDAAHRLEEAFCANGSWMFFGSRVPVVQGRHEIVNDEFCVTVRNQEETRCRALYRDRSGAYFVGHRRGEGMQAVRLTPTDVCG